MLIDIYMKFVVVILNRFKLQSGHDFVTDKVPREITQKMQELWFLRSACHLMFIDIYMKFHKDSLNGFQVIVDTIL